MAHTYFVIGTDTDVGKTYVTCRLLEYFVQAGFTAIGMKPIASGCNLNGDGELLNEDVLALCNASNLKASADLINPYRFAPAIAPHLAAEQANVTMDLAIINAAYQQLTKLAEVVIVEGAGGFFVPINQKQTLADLAVLLNIPIILVVGVRLGCINHALLTVEALQARGLNLKGWIANEVEPDMMMFEGNVKSLQQRINAPCLSIVRWQGELVIDLT